MGKLYVCATPIGNLEDMTFRAIRVLKEVDLIAAEDTRHTKVLLQHYSIKTPLTSYHKFNLKEKTFPIVSEIKNGKDVALVSDAGMPGVSDPGAELIALAIKNGIEVVPVPGPSAAIAALAVSGFSTDPFAFEGFLPSKASERIKRLEELDHDARTMVFYEAPHRLVESLTDIGRVFPDRRLAVAREMTKKFEEVIRGTPGEALEYFKKTPLKGEITIVLEGFSGKKEPRDTGAAKKLIKGLAKFGISNKDISKFVSEHLGLPRNEVYAIVLKVLRK